MARKLDLADALRNTAEVQAQEETRTTKDIRMSVAIPSQLKADVKLICALQETNINALINDLLEEYREKYKDLLELRTEVAKRGGKK